MGIYLKLRRTTASDVATAFDGMFADQERRGYAPLTGQAATLAGEQDELGQRAGGLRVASLQLELD
jgi:hypothetical protein